MYYLSLDIDNYNFNNVSFFNPINNAIIENSIFTKILYSTPFFICNNIFINISNECVIYEEKNGKNMYSFIISDAIAEKIYNIEQDLLNKYNNNSTHFQDKFNFSNRKYKQPLITINNRIKNNTIKIFYNPPANNETTNVCNIYSPNILPSAINTKATIILKISGVWENENFYGITFKFILSK
jgi:hypothetical protein